MVYSFDDKNPAEFQGFSSSYILTSEYLSDSLSQMSVDLGARGLDLHFFVRGQRLGHVRAREGQTNHSNMRSFRPPYTTVTVQSELHTSPASHSITPGQPTNWRDKPHGVNGAQFFLAFELPALVPARVTHTVG